MNALHQQILDDIKARSDWELRQQTWYQMRHNGLRRAAKPYPNAPDLHFPLIDASIDKHKPLLVQQLYARDTLAGFVSKKTQNTESASAVGAWFDYKLKQESNFEREAISAFDGLLVSGGAPVKVYWDQQYENQLGFSTCDPTRIIVPFGTVELPKANRLVHVLVLTEDEYRWNKTYRADDEFVKSITGKGNSNQGDESTRRDEIAMREGLTHGKDKEIVVWEIYTRDPSNWKRVIVKTRSPVRFDEAVRPDFELPFSEGVFKKGWFPFTKWRAEIKDKGYYAPRGLAEIQAPFETSLSKSWNFKHEWMDFFARPMFEQSDTATTGNIGNFTTVPGAIVPQGLKPITPPQIPTALQEDMNLTRQMAEYRVQAPDFGVLAQEGGKRTAREISEIAGQSGQGTDLRARVVSLDLGDTFKMAYAILLQFGRDSLAYILNGESKSLEQTSLEDCYEITPNGSAESWNKPARVAKAWARYDRLKGNPYIKQGELTKATLEDDEPGLVSRLYQEPQDAQAGEAEEQAMELAIMEMGFPAAIDPTDDDKAHLITMAQYFQQKQTNAEPIRPRTARLGLKHGADHTNALLQKKDPDARQINQQMLPIIQMLSVIAAQPDPAEVAAQAQANVIPMEQGPGSPGAISQPAPVPSDLQPQGAMQ